MPEHFRTKTHQFCDSEAWVIIDAHCGIERIFPGGEFYGTEEQAMAIIAGPGWENRRIAVRLECVRGFKFDTIDEVQSLLQIGGGDA